VVKGYQEGRKGTITYRVPVFDLKDVSAETADQALALDATLQAYLGAYLSQPPQHRGGPSATDAPPPRDEAFSQALPDDIDDDDIPF